MREASQGGVHFPLKLNKLLILTYYVCSPLCLINGWQDLSPEIPLVLIRQRFTMGLTRTELVLQDAEQRIKME